MLIKVINKILNNQKLLGNYYSRSFNTPSQTIGQSAEAEVQTDEKRMLIGKDVGATFDCLYTLWGLKREDEESTGVAYGGVVLVEEGGVKRIRKACLIERQDYWLTSPPVTVVTHKTVSNMNSVKGYEFCL